MQGKKNQISNNVDKVTNILKYLDPFITTGYVFRNTVSIPLVKNNFGGVAVKPFPRFSLHTSALSEGLSVSGTFGQGTHLLTTRQA